jgi:cobalamin biosynthesis protein CobT
MLRCSSETSAQSFETCKLFHRGTRSTMFDCSLRLSQLHPSNINSDGNTNSTLKHGDCNSSSNNNDGSNNSSNNNGSSSNTNQNSNDNDNDGTGDDVDMDNDNKADDQLLTTACSRTTPTPKPPPAQAATTAKAAAVTMLGPLHLLPVPIAWHRTILYDL